MGRKVSRLDLLNRKARIAIAIILIVLAIPTYFVLRKATQSETKFIQLNFIALLLGLVFEFIRISGKWSLVLWTAIGSYAFSFIAFLPGKNEKEYIFENHLENWPYVFLMIFMIVALFSQYAKAMQRLHEGLTLLLTLSINYWIIANEYWNSGSVFVKVMIILNGLLSIITVLNAISYRELTKGTRLMLSIWSSIIVLILAFDNFIQLFRYRDIEHLATLSEAAFVFFQFFLLGVSSIYIAQNAFMILSYLPGKQYRESVSDMNKEHVERFSKEQVDILDSLIVIGICLLVFTLNYFYHFIPVNLLIWATIVITPLLLNPIYQLLKMKRVRA